MLVTSSPFLLLSVNTTIFINLMVEAASISETTGNFYQTTLRNNPEDSQIFSLRHGRVQAFWGSPSFLLNGYQS
jgi:hypothetical protein